MSKKLICLLLGVIMILSVCLASCGKDATNQQANIANKASASAETLVMYIMTDAPVSADTAAQIQNAVNSITENKFTTRLKLYFYTEEEYYAKLDAAFAARAEAKANGTIFTDKDTDTSADGPAFNPETGKIEIKYPKVAEYQVDMFYLGGKANFDKYKSAGMLTKLDDEINGSSQLLKTNITNQYLNSIKTLNSGTYAIPTSKVIGEYTYLLLNKDALTAAYRRNESGVNDYSAYTSLTCENVQDFVEFVESNLSSTYDSIYTNLSEEELLINNLKYWGVDENGNLSDAFSVLGGYYNDDMDFRELNAYAGIENLFENEDFVKAITSIKTYEVNGHIKREIKEGDKQFAVGYVKGGAELAEIYGDDYELVPIETPRLDEELLYSDLYAVCSYTKSVGRSMEILTLLNTDETFRNLLLYGIEGEHYRLVDTKIETQYGDTIKAVEKFEKGKTEYVMDVNKTGNTFVAYPIYEEGSNYSLKSYQILQNQIAKVDLDLGFALEYEGHNVDVEKLKDVKTLSAEILADYLACDSEAKIAEFITNSKAKIAANESVQFHLNAEEATSLVSCYNYWLKDVKIVK